MNEEFKKEILRICDVSMIDRDFKFRGNIDSLSRADLILTVEGMLGVELSNAEILAMNTYGDLEDIINDKMKAKLND